MTTAMGNDPATPGQGWTITGQTQSDELDGSGKFVSGINVLFRTQHGIDGKVWIPDAMYTPNNVRKEVAARAETMDRVQFLHLTGE